MPIVIGRGAASAVLSGGIEQAIRETLSRLAPTLGRRVEAEAERLERGAVGRWPIGRDRGRPHSRDLFDSGLRIVSDGIEGFVSNRAPYIIYIKTMKNGLQGKSPYQELLRKPLRAAAKTVAGECADDVHKLIRGA